MARLGIRGVGKTQASASARNSPRAPVFPRERENDSCHSTRTRVVAEDQSTNRMSLIGRFLLLAVLYALLWPNIVGFYKRSHQCCATSCINNLRQIQGAKETWALESGKGTNAFVYASDLFGPTLYIKSPPKCPQGGRYRLGRVAEPPTCSFPEHRAYTNYFR